MTPAILGKELDFSDPKIRLPIAMTGSLGWAIAVGMLLGMLSGLLALREGVFTAVSAGAFLAAGSASLPPVLRWMKARYPETWVAKQPLLWVFLFSGIAIAALALGARTH